MNMKVHLLSLAHTHTHAHSSMLVGGTITLSLQSPGRFQHTWETTHWRQEPMNADQGKKQIITENRFYLKYGSTKGEILAWLRFGSSQSVLTSNSVILITKIALSSYRLLVPFCNCKYQGIQ